MLNVESTELILESINPNGRTSEETVSHTLAQLYHRRSFKGLQRL